MPAKTTKKTAKKAAPKQPEYVPTLEDERLRETAAKADKLELEIKIKRNEYVNCELADKFYGDKVFSFRNKMLALPHGVSNEIAAESDPVKIEDILSSRIEEYLSDLSGASLQWAAKNGKI